MPDGSLPVSAKKETNPKDAVGVRKVSLSVVPKTVLMRVALALMEGARKYGKFNWRVAGVRSSVYMDATYRHLANWEEGRDIDPDSGLHEIEKAIASLIVLRDAMLHGTWEDDRQPRAQAGWCEELNTLAGELIDRYPECALPFTQKRADEEAAAAQVGSTTTTSSWNPHPLAGDPIELQTFGPLNQIELRWSPSGHRAECYRDGEFVGNWWLEAADADGAIVWRFYAPDGGVVCEQDKKPCGIPVGL